MARPKNRHTKYANPIVRKFKPLQWVLIMMCATLLNPNQHSQCLTASSVRARERQSRAPKKGILGVFCRGPYHTRVTVYPYNRYIGGTNPIARHVMSLNCTPIRMCAHFYFLHPAFPSALSIQRTTTISFEDRLHPWVSTIWVLFSDPVITLRSAKMSTKVKG